MTSMYCLNSALLAKKKKHTAQNYSTRCKKYENRLELHYITKGRKCQYKLQKIVIYFWKGAKQWIHQY